MEKFNKFWSRGFSLWASWQILNIVAGTQSVLDMSQSIHFLTGWWNYYLKIPFDWINWDISLVERNAIVLIGLAFSAVNIALNHDRKMNIFQMFMDCLKNRGQKTLEFTKTSVKNHKTVFCALFAALLLFFVFSIFLLFKNWTGPILPLVAGYTLVGFLVLLKIWLNDEKAWTSRTFVRIASSQISLFGFVPLALVIYWRKILSILGLVLVILLLDFAFTHIIDPFAPMLENLPEPPPVD